MTASPRFTATGLSSENPMARGEMNSVMPRAWVMPGLHKAIGRRTSYLWIDDGCLIPRLV